MILFDIDNFKTINDTHGHEVGDSVIKAVAELSARTVRAVDLAARWGGEEFALLLPNTPEAGAVTLANKMRVSLESLESLPVRVTASFGVGVFRYGEGATEFFKRVDGALYAAKRAGKNRVVTAEDARATLLS